MNVGIFVKTYEGRQLLSEILVAGGMWSQLYAPEPSDQAYMIGRRSLALELWQKVLQNHPESISVILTEQLRRELEAIKEDPEDDDRDDPFE